MDLIPFIDAVGEPGSAMVGGLLLGLVFGVAAQRSAFCTRTAVLDLTRGRTPAALAIWLAGFGLAMLGVQYLLGTGALVVSETRFFATAQSLSGAVVGGLLFGFGMVLARGCVSRLLVLGASGNLRAVFCIAIIAVVGLATYDGLLVPLRDSIAGVANTTVLGGNDLLAHLGLGTGTGMTLGALILAAGLVVSVGAGVSPWRILGGLAVGATIVGGWYFTWQLSTQVFEPIQAESLSFIRPLATTGELALGTGGLIGMDQGLLFGTIVGAFLAAFLSGQFRIAAFSEPGTPHVLRYVAGSVLMGFGGILAVGCTIGAGFTGGSVLAVTSLVGLASMVGGAALADRFVDRHASLEPALSALPAAAE